MHTEVSSIVNGSHANLDTFDLKKNHVFTFGALPILHSFDFANIGMKNSSNLLE